MQMKRILILAAALCLALSATVWGAAPAVSPFESQPADPLAKRDLPTGKAFGDPGDFMAGALAGSDYLVMMQADVSETIDNAGNGLIDTDPDDGGWDWRTTAFSHSTSASPTNLYGVTALGLFETYLLDPQPSHLIAMQDAADKMVAIGPDPGGIRSASDVIFLLKFATLPECTNPSFYQGGAQAIWNRHLTVYGSMAGLAAYIRDARAGQGYPNGIIAWDIGAWAEAAMLMHAAFPAGGHDLEGAAIAEVLYQDSYMANPGYFEPFGHSQGYDPAWSTPDYYWYSIGITGLIQAFATTGTHTAELPALQTVLLACQYPDGSISDQYGAQGGDADWQATAYAVMGMVHHLGATPALAGPISSAASWLAATQDASGGWVYDSGNHYPEIGGECTTALALATDTTYATLSSSVTGPDPVLCGQTKTVTVAYVPGLATAPLRGYEITFGVTGPVTFVEGDIHDAGALAGLGLHYFDVVDNGDGTFTVNDALLGTTTGLTTAGDLFSVDLTTAGDGPVQFDILSYKLREPDNTPIMAFFSGLGFTVDCTAPAPVTGITAAPGHEKVDVSWTHDGTDVAYYEIWRGLWYDATPGTSAYPEYDDLAADVIPTRPTTRTDAFNSPEWEFAGSVLVGTLSFEDGGMTTGRGVYYYEVFPVDVPGNIGGVAAANDRATNYWLGDVDLYDGDVDAGDITVLGATFGWSDGITGYNNEADVGPTDDNSGVGIPETDSVIDFEDLMIFAMNYGNVSKLAIPASGTPALSWRQVEPGLWSLTLTEPCASLKGLRVTAPLPDGVHCTVEAGALLDGQGMPVFLRNIDANGLDANLAVIGNGAGLLGSGEVLRVHVPEAVDLGQAGIKARGIGNEDLDPAVGSSLPARFVAEQNFPNPFNPSTTIAFSLPESRFVTLAIYGVDGSLVRTLNSSTMAAGRHKVVWDGTDDGGATAASGTYFFRLSAGPDQVVRKMLLVK
ncbi:MAG: FlgD immunoglobulin-like domain containing protein [Candidatus Krumholzibacteriia bacterium]